MTTNYSGNIINAFSNKDFKLTNTAIGISSNIDPATPGTIIYNADLDRFEGYVSSSRAYNNSNFVPMNMDVATQSNLGGIKIGNNLSMTSDGILNSVAESLSRKFQKTLIVSQSYQINGNIGQIPDKLTTGDYQSINQCIKQYFDYDPNTDTYSGEISTFNKDEYPDPSANNKYIILLCPGEYKEANDIITIPNNKTIEMPPHTVLVGDDRDGCVININNLTSIQMREGCILRNLTIDLTNANENLTPSSTTEIIKGIEILTSENNIIIDNVVFKLSVCNMNTSFVYTNTNNNITISDIYMATPSIPVGVNGFLDANDISINVIDTRATFLNLNNLDIYVESNSHKKSIIKAQELSLVNCKSSKLEIKELNTSTVQTIENQVLYLIDSTYNTTYSNYKCQGFDNNFSNNNIRNQGIRIDSTQNYNEISTTRAVFQHIETNNSHDLIKVPTTDINFQGTYINGSRIKITGTDNNNLVAGVSYIGTGTITELGGLIAGSFIGCDVVTNLVDEVIDTSDSKTVIFKELYQVNLFSCQVSADSHTIYADNTESFTDNYFIQATQTLLNGVNANVGLNTLLFNVPNEIIVGKEDSNFNSIADALNSINNANSVNKVIVRVKPGTYLESKQLILQEHVSLIGENCVVKFDVNPSGFPDSVCVKVASNTLIQDIEFLFNSIQDNTKINIGFASINYASSMLSNLSNESYFDGISSISNVVLNSLKITITDGFVSTQTGLLGGIFAKVSNLEFNNLKVSVSHNITSSTLLDAKLFYTKLCQTNFNNINVDINGYIENFNYYVFLNDASNNVFNNPSIRTIINTNSNVNNASFMTLIETRDLFIDNINTLDLSIYNTLVLGGTNRGTVNNEVVEMYALYANYNSTLINVGCILEGLCKDLNDMYNNHPNSFLKTMNCYLLSSEGDIVAGISEVDNNGQPTINFDSLHVGDPVGALNGIIPRENVLVGIRVAIENQTGIRNVMMGVDVGTFQVSGENNVYLGYRSGRKNLRNDNVFIGSQAGTEITEGIGSVIIGSSTAANADNMTDNVIIGKDTAQYLDSVSNAVIIGANSMNTSNNSGTGNLISIGSKGVGDNLTTGSELLSVGNESLLEATTLSDTVNVGHKSLQDTQTGRYNVTVGNNIGNNISEMRGSVVVGNNAGAGSISTSKNINNIMIGNNTAGAITTAKDNILVGNSVGPSITTGSRNMLIGSRRDGQSVLTGPAPKLTTGNDNIVLGTEAAVALTTGSRNIIMGNKSGDSLNTTSDTIILGYDSGNSLTGGGVGINKNIIIGNHAANIATSGNVIIIGHEAGKNLTGDDSLVIGNMAARNLSGGRNTVIGNKAAGLSDSSLNPVVGTDNVLIGTHTGYNISTASYNVILGSGDGSSITDEQGFDNAGSGYSLQSGHKNFLAGFNSGRSLVTGSENMLVGYRAGYSLTHSNRNLIFGNNAGTKLGFDDGQTPSNNNLILGNDAGSNISVGKNLIFIGQSAGKNSIEGQNNTFIGNNAGENNNGNDNTYIGNQSGQSTVTGDKNTMIGVSSGKFTDNANFNTFIGYEAGKGKSADLLNSGDYNTIIGYQAGSNIVSGNQNMYLGYQAGQQNEFGSKNIAIGPNAGLKSTTSRSIFIGATENVNTGIGMNTTGQLNLFIGTDTGVANTIGEKNTFLGSHTGQNNVSGSGGIFIGVDAGKNNTTGNDNTLIGREAGKDLITGVNNIMIGKQAGTEVTNGASENILIGTLAGSKTQVNDSINIGNKSGQNNETGIGNILIGSHTGQKFEQSCNNIMIGSNAGANFQPTGSNITLGENIYIGPEVGRYNVTGTRNIIVGSEAFKSSVQGSGVIAIGYKAGQNSGVISDIVSNQLYENTIIGFEAGSQGDYANKNLMIGSQSGRNINNPYKFSGNILLGAESGKNSNLSINSIILGNANKLGQGGINNVIAGTNAGDNLGNIYKSEYISSISPIYPGFNTVNINATFGDITNNLSINDSILIYDNISRYEGIITNINNVLDNILGEYIIITLDRPYIGSIPISIGSRIKLISNIDITNVGDLDISKSSSNTLLGYQTSYNLKTGSKNVSIGDNSMYNNIIGKYNNILGTNAGYNIKTDNNTIFGTKSGYYLDSYISNTNVTFNYSGFNIIDNTIYFEDNISDELNFGSIIDIENTTANNKRLKIIQTTSNSITIESYPRIDELGVDNTIDPDSIIINAVNFSFNNKNISNQNIQITKTTNNDLTYPIITNLNNNLGTQLEYVYQIEIIGSKYNDGVKYLYKDNTITDNILLRTYNSLYPEVFDSNVQIISRTISTIDSISSGYSFQDINPNATFYSSLGGTKGIYRVKNCECKYAALKPLKNTISVVDIIIEQDNIINNLFGIGHIEDIDLDSMTYIKQEEYTILGNINFYNSNNNILFENSIPLSIGNNDDYYLIKGTQNNNNIIIKLLTDINNDKKLINVEVISGTLNNEIITSSIINPVTFSTTQITNLNKDNSDIFTKGSILNINITHSLGQKIINGTFLIENSYSDNNMIFFSDNNNSILPTLHNKITNTTKNNVQMLNNDLTVETIKKNVNFKFNRETFTVDTDYLNNKSSQIAGFDFFYQNNIINNAGTLNLFNSNNHIVSTIKFGFKDIIAPCMIKLDDVYYLVDSNKYPFQILEINNNYTVNDTITNSNIYVNSITTYQHSANLDIMLPNTTYKIFGNEINHLTEITTVSDTSGISKNSVYLTDTSNINNYQSNYKLIIAESRHDDYDFIEDGIPSEGFGRGYFKYLDIGYTNFDTIFSNLTVKYENVSVLTPIDVESNYFMFGTIDSKNDNNKYNIVKLGAITEFKIINTPIFSFDGSNTLNEITLNNEFILKQESFTTFKISSYGYLLFEGNNGVYTFNFLLRHKEKKYNYIDSSSIFSSIEAEYKSSDGGITNDILLITFYSTNNDYNGVNNCQLEIYLNNSTSQFANKIFIYYSIDITNNVILGVDFTDTIIKDSITSDIDNLIVNINNNNIIDYENKLITFTPYYKYTYLEKLIASDSETNDYFGKSVAIYGDYVVIGSYLDDNTDGNNSGAAYVFKKGSNKSFTQLHKLTANNGSAYNEFGSAIAIYGDYIVISSIGDDINGSAYIFKNDGSDSFTQLQKLTPSYSSTTATEYFGKSVSIYGDYIIVSSSINNPINTVYIFKNNGSDSFTELQILNNYIGGFGNSVSIYGDYIVIGAYLDNNGSAYIFKNNGANSFTELHKISASDGVTGDNFGYSVDIYGDYIVIGAAYNDSDSGAAYIFKKGIDNSFTELHKIIASDGNVYERFGNSVNMYGDYIVIGSYYNDNTDNGSDSGAAYIFKNDGSDSFTQLQKIIADDGNANDNFGISVAIYGGYIVIGSNGDDSTDNGTNSGSAYIYKLNDNIFISNISNLESNLPTSLLGYNEINTTNVTLSNTYNYLDATFNSFKVYNGLIYLETDDNSDYLIPHNYLSILNNFNYNNNIYYKENVSTNNLSLIFRNNFKTYAELVISQTSGDIIFKLGDINELNVSNVTLGLCINSYNNYNNFTVETDYITKEIIINNLEEINNLDLLANNDILILDDRLYQLNNITSNTLLINTTDVYEVLNINSNIKINQYVGYDENTNKARYDFEKLRKMTGEHSDFLRFIKLRQPDILTEYSNQEKTTLNYPDITMLDKGLNFKINPLTFNNDNTFNSNIFTKYIIPLKETVPNEYFGSDSSNILLRQDYYTIALGEPVFDASTSEEEIQNINITPKGIIDIFVRDNQNINNNNTLIFDSNKNSNETYLGNIEISSSSISFIDLNLTDTSTYIENKIYNGIKKYKQTQPFTILKPGNMIYLSKDGIGINGNHSNSTYIIKDYSNDGLTIDIDPIFNNTSNIIQFTENETLKIELSNIYIGTELPSIYSTGHIISERYNFNNFSNITAYDSNNSNIFKTRQFLALTNYPILNNKIQATVSGESYDIYNFIDYSIPEWGIKPVTKDIVEYDNSNVQVSLDFFYNSSTNFDEVILDTGSHNILIPTSNISTNINSTNIIFKVNNYNNVNLIFDVDNYTIQNASGNTIDFTEFSKGQIIYLQNNININNTNYNQFIFGTVQVSLTIEPSSNLLVLEQTYGSKSFIDSIIEYNNLSGQIILTNYNINSSVILSKNPTETDLSVFNVGQKIKISNTQYNNGNVIINQYSYTTNICLLINSDLIDEEPRYCLLESIILQQEYGVIKNKTFTINSADNSITINESNLSTSNILSGFTKNQLIEIKNSSLNNGTYTTINTLYPELRKIYVQENLNNPITEIMDLYKKITIKLIGKPIISTAGSSSIYHYIDAQGNNLMLGSFTGQYCGIKNLAIHNTYIGNKVGQTNHGSGNIFFGNETGLATKPNEGESFFNNKFAVYKNNFIGVPIKPLIGGDFGSGRVGINTINPDTLLTSTLESTTRLVVNGAVRASSHSTFTGTHMITLSKNTKVADLVPGMILSSTGNVKKLNIIDTIVECEITNKIKDKKVFGIYANSEIKDDSREYVHYVAGVGEGQIWVSNINGNIEAGDYVCSSLLPGYAQLQDDDLTHNYTIAKITETIDWSKVINYKLYNNTNYKVSLISCVYMCS